ncbi:MAG TPA: ABC transporter permease, partial [Chitinophagaceae bacterium]
MFRNYFKTAFRNMQRQKLYAAVNIGGFALGIAACLLIALYIKHELSYDRQIAHGDRVYRVLGVDKSSGTPRTATAFPPPMAKALLNDFPQIEKAGRIMPNTLFGGANNQVRRVDQEHDNYETGFCFADSSIMDILDIKMVYGNRETALSEPNTIVLCKSLADKYFPHQDPVGKLLIFNDNTQRPLKVGGVMQDFPSTSHLQYRSFISLSGLSFWPGEQEGWGSSNYPIYLLLKPGTNVPRLEKAITSDVLNKYMVPTLKSMGRADIQRF